MIPDALIGGVACVTSTRTFVFTCVANSLFLTASGSSGVLFAHTQHTTHHNTPQQHNNTTTTPSGLGDGTTSSGLRIGCGFSWGPRPPSVCWPPAHQNRRNQSAAGQSGAGKVKSRVKSKKPESKVPKKDLVQPEAIPKVRVSHRSSSEGFSESCQVGSSVGCSRGFGRCRRRRSDCVEGVIEESAGSSGTNQPRPSSRRVPAVRVPHKTPTREGPIRRCSAAFGTDITGTVARRFSGNRSVASGGCRCSSGPRGQHVRVGRSSSAGATIDARTRQLVVERIVADRWSWRKTNRSFEFNVGLVEAGDAKRRCLGSGTEMRVMD